MRPPGNALRKMAQKSDRIGGVSCLYFLRNYGVLLVVAIICCTPVPLRIYDWLKKHTVLKIIVVFALLLMCIAYIVASTNSPFLYFRF